MGFGGQWGYYTDQNIQLLAAGGPTCMGLIRTGRRFYDPYIARFLTRDPLRCETGVITRPGSDRSPVDLKNRPGFQ